jgi:hypothetical protein
MIIQGWVRSENRKMELFPGDRLPVTVSADIRISARQRLDGMPVTDRHTRLMVCPSGDATMEHRQEFNL